MNECLLPKHTIVSGLSKPFNTNTKVFFFFKESSALRKNTARNSCWHMNQRQHSYDNINTKRQRKQIALRQRQNGEIVTHKTPGQETQETGNDSQGEPQSEEEAKSCG